MKDRKELYQYLNKNPRGSIQELENEFGKGTTKELGLTGIIKGTSSNKYQTTKNFQENYNVIFKEPSLKEKFFGYIIHFEFKLFGVNNI